MEPFVMYSKGEYLIVIHSSENDGDCPRVCEMVVENESAARSTIDFAKLFTADGIGNLCAPSLSDLDNVDAVFSKFIIEHPGFVETHGPLSTREIRDCMMEFASELGLSGSGDWYSRLFDYAEVYRFDSVVMAWDLSESIVQC